MIQDGVLLVFKIFGQVRSNKSCSNLTFHLQSLPQPCHHQIQHTRVKEKGPTMNNPQKPCGVYLPQSRCSTRNRNGRKNSQNHGSYLSVSLLSGTLILPNPFYTLFSLQGRPHPKVSYCTLSTQHSDIHTKYLQSQILTSHLPFKKTGNRFFTYPHSWLLFHHPSSLAQQRCDSENK